MPIYPLPVFEADLAAAKADAETYERLKPPTSIVVRFGSMKLVGEFPYSGDSKPGCGSKLVVRTHRGVELGEMLTSTCPNAGCSKSVTRQEMLQYIENSGGSDYPFFTEGRVLRVATIDDLNEQRRVESLKSGMRKTAQIVADRLDLKMKIVEAEPILGGDRLTIYYTSEDRVDFREMVTELAREYSCRIEMRQVGARDEARLVADYERCGQHCCCKQFLKVLKPVSMKSAKVQKATLDPLKISGRCGRLMCCLRYEDQTYTELDKRLPRLKARVGTPHGVGVVVDRQILTQLVLVFVEGDEPKQVAVPFEELVSPEEAAALVAKRKAEAEDPLRGMSAEEVARRAGGRGPGREQQSADRQSRQRDRVQREDRRPRPGAQPSPERAEEPKRREPRPAPSDATGNQAPAGANTEAGPDGATRQSDERKRRRRRRRRSNRPEGTPESQPGGGETPTGERPAGPRPERRQRPPRPEGEAPQGGGGDSPNAEGQDSEQRRRRRRRRRRGPRPEGGQGGDSGGGPPSPASPAE